MGSTLRVCEAEDKDMSAILVVSRKTLSKIINERGSLGRAIAIQLDL